MPVLSTSRAALLFGPGTEPSIDLAAARCPTQRVKGCEENLELGLASNKTDVVRLNPLLVTFRIGLSSLFLWDSLVAMCSEPLSGYLFFQISFKVLRSGLCESVQSYDADFDRLATIVTSGSVQEPRTVS